MPLTKKELKRQQKAMKGKKGKGWIVAVVIVLVIGLLAAAAAAFFFLRMSRSDGDYQKGMDAAAGYMEEENYREAESQYKAALESKPGDEAATVGLAKCYVAMNDYKKAEETYREILDENKKSGEAVLGLAELQMIRGDLREAEKTLKDFSPKKGETDAYDRMMGAIQSSPRITDISVDNFPEVKVEIAVDGDVDVDLDTVSLTEDGSGCTLNDVQRTGDGVEAYYETDGADTQIRTVAAELAVNGYTLSVEECDYEVPYVEPAAPMEAPTAAPSASPSASPAPAAVADWGICAGWYQNLDDSSEVLGVVWESPYLYLNTVSVDVYPDAMDAIARHNMGQDTRSVSDILWDYAYDWRTLDMTDVPENTWWEKDDVWFYPADESGFGEDAIYVGYDKVYLRWDGQVPEETGDDGYILPTDSTYITYDDLAGMDKETVMLARNEIYARHGYTFQSEEIQAYFDAKSWYYNDPYLNSSTFTSDMMNDYERANLDVILEYERAQGWK